MFEFLAAYLKKKGSLTDDEIAQIREYTVVKSLRRKQHLLQEGEVSHYNSFVAKGCMRLYHMSADGNEHVLRFAVEEWWISDYESYHTGNLSKNYIDALEDSVLVMFHKRDFDALVKAIPNFQKLIEKLDTRSYDASQNRILSTIGDSAEVRYEKFITTYPGISNRVSLRLIASYLGLTRETLSRVRRQYGKTAK